MGKWGRRLAAAGACLAALCAGVFVWVQRSDRFAHTSPGYACVDLSGPVARAEAGRPDYALLFAQTGLGPPAVDALLRQGRGRELFDFQAQFFAPCNWSAQKGAAMVRLETTETPLRFAPLETGDILLTSSSRCGGWRNGHAALLVNAEEGLVLESYSLGWPSQLSSLSTWQDKACVAVLRLKNTPAAARAAIAAAARQNLLGLPYSLTVGLWGRDKSGFLPSATQCAHLVWCAFAAFGYDLDATPGWPVTPRDIALCSRLEVVQVYGLPQGRRWPS